MNKRWVIALMLCGWLLPLNLAVAGEKTVRPSPVAGSWYPADPRELTDLLDRLLREAPTTEWPQLPLRALIAPHAGYRFSGAVAASAFKPLQTTPNAHQPRRVVVLGPAHHWAFKGLALPQATHFRTPLGEIPLDQEAMQRLVTQKTAQVIPEAFPKEHSIDMELPWLQRVLTGEWRLLPLLVGRLTVAEAQELASRLRPLLDEQTLLVVSGDFTHFGADHGYQPFPVDEHTRERIQTLDQGAIDRILARDAKGLATYGEETGITACALHPLLILLPLLPPDSHPRLIHYATSAGLTGGDNHHSVSYVALGVMAKNPLNAAAESSVTAPSEADLPETLMRLLHRMATRALTVAVSAPRSTFDGALVAAEFTLPSRFKERSGAFVTLKKKGELRGCIGTIEPLMPLHEAVILNAKRAALEDTRFAPVILSELAELEVEVSVLSVPAPIPGPEAYRVERHGIILNQAGRRALFLPEVATEQGWSREQTLTALSRKAGLPPEAWRQGARLEVFTTQTFTAPYAP